MKKHKRIKALEAAVESLQHQVDTLQVRLNSLAATALIDVVGPDAVRVTWTGNSPELALSDPPGVRQTVKAWADVFDLPEAQPDTYEDDRDWGEGDPVADLKRAITEARCPGLRLQGEEDPPR